MIDKLINPISRTALIICFLPILAINLSYIIAVAAGNVPSCFPYFDGCTSISSTGRSPPSSYIFKPAMIITAVLMIWFWFWTSQWLNLLGEQSTSFRRQLMVIGSVGAIALFIYVYFLGTEGTIYRLMRRYGVTVYFGFTYLAQLLLAGRLYRLAKQNGNQALLNISRLMLALCVLLLVIGLISIPVTNNIIDNNVIEMVIEWNLALLLQIYFLFFYFACQHSKSG